MAERLEGVDPAHVLLLVLTFDQARLAAAVACVRLGAALRHLAGLPVDAEHRGGDVRFLAFRTLWRRWQSLRQTLHRESERRGERRARWAQTVEVHRSGWPHANVVMEWPWLARELLEQKHDCSRIRYPAERCGAENCVRDWLAEHAEACGFGRVLSLEVARSATAVCGYALKLAGELEREPHGRTEERWAPRVDPDTGEVTPGELRPVLEVGRAVAEVVKLTQLPLAAPPHFRRIRASMKAPAAGVESFLAPPRRSPTIVAGALCGQPAAVVEAAVDRGLDLVEQVDPDTGAVRFVSWLARTRAPPPGPGWLEELLVPRRLELERMQASWNAWYTANCPELA